MEIVQPRRVIVHDDTEFYVTVVKLRKPITIIPMDGDKGQVTLSEMECRALLVPPGGKMACQCGGGTFPPDYPFIVEESQE